jgi:hypothetical protein
MTISNATAPKDVYCRDDLLAAAFWYLRLEISLRCAVAWCAEAWREGTRCVHRILVVDVRVHSASHPAVQGVKEKPCGAKVCDLQLYPTGAVAVDDQQYVRWLEVSVHYALRVHVGESLRQLARQGRRKHVREAI